MGFCLFFPPYSSLATFCYVFSRSITVSVTGCGGTPGGSKAHYGMARGLPRMPARSLPARHVLIRSPTFLTFCQGFLLMKPGCWAALEHVCAYCIKRRPPKQYKIIVSWDFDEATSWMPKMKKILCLYVCWVHTSILCVSLKKKASSSCREGRPECSRQGEGDEGDEGEWEGQDQFGYGNGYRKTEDSSSATTQHFSPKSSAPKIPRPSRTIWGCLRNFSTRSWKE